MMMHHHWGGGGGGGPGSGQVYKRLNNSENIFQTKPRHTHRLQDGQTDTVIPVYPANFVTGSTKRLLTSMRCDGNSLKWEMADTC